MNKDEIRKKAIQRTRQQLKEGVDRDKHVVQAVKTLETHKQQQSEQIETFREWYKIHFPEFVKEIQDDEHFVKLLSRELNKEKMSSFQEMAESSTGQKLPPAEQKILEKTLENIKNSQEKVQELEEYIEDTIKEEMPNLDAVLGPQLTAKMLAHTGSLEKLAKQPSSTIQMLGAEKALFRYLKGEGTPPKHGVIFEHNKVNTLPEDQRGKMARFIANKAALAARLDQYGDKDKGESYRDEIQQKYLQIKQEIEEN